MGSLSCANDVNLDPDIEAKRKALSLHNRYRNKHKVKNLKISEELCEKAKKKISKLMKKNDDEFIDDEDEEEELGENLYISYKGLVDVERILKDWYDEKNKYDFNKNKYQKGTGHFTQMIWKDTKEIGFGWDTSENNKFYFLAYYYPAGNEIGKFKENVLVEEKN